MGRAFVTKLWNALRFVLAYPETEENGELSPSDRWILSEFSRTVREYDAYLEECEFSEAMRRIYAFAWNQFADWYIEIAKAAPSSATPRVLREVFHGILKLLHPVMPFATEEMASVMGEQALLATQRYPEPDPALEDEEADRASLPAGDVVVEILLSDEMRRGEIERLKREISRAEQEVARAQSKLSNEKFVTNAPERIVAGEREKLDVNARMLETLSRRLDEYT
jgi:valyl-tRNA synthetase